MKLENDSSRYFNYATNRRSQRRPTNALQKCMNIAVMTFRLHSTWVHSLKEKRMIVKSIVAKLQNRFHVSAAEVDEQDIHQIAVIGVAAIVPHNAMADSLMDEISRFVKENTEAEIIETSVDEAFSLGDVNKVLRKVVFRRVEGEKYLEYHKNEIDELGWLPVRAAIFTFGGKY